jgi:excisionase family DNA binding protein
VCTRTVRQLAADGKLTPHRLGHRTVRYRLDEVEALMEQSAEKAG